MNQPSFPDPATENAACVLANTTNHGNPFAQRLADEGQTLQRTALTTLQLNLGKMCNLACHHCHVEAGPNRTEIMTWPTMQRILAWLDATGTECGIATADLTGGAPEMNPHFKTLVKSLRARNIHVLDRCNLTILLEPEHTGLIPFFAAHQVEIVASLPCYLEENVDGQRGKGVFNGSIQALRRLNEVGYGQAGSDLRLDLVYNPVGYGLPPDQDSLQQDYKTHLSKAHGIVFNRLWTITNMPIRRFANNLERDGEYARYMTKLMAAHNAANVDGVMCRSLISVGWQGTVYDCDFNQMLQMTIDPDTYGPGDGEHEVEFHGKKVWQFHPKELVGRSVRTASHCFGCTAGAGSSCTGALA